MHRPGPHVRPQRAGLPQRAHARLRRPQRGVALILAAILLLVVTMQALATFRGSALNERIAGNTMEKQRAVQVAQSALQYAEWWLSWYPNQAGNSLATLTTDAVQCSGDHFDANTVANMRVCANALTNAQTDLTWPGAGNYTPPGMTVQAGGNKASSGDINYSQAGALYITYLPARSDPIKSVFLITAVGYGGNAGSTAVLESTFVLIPNSGSAGGPGFSTDN